MSYRSVVAFLIPGLLLFLAFHPEGTARAQLNTQDPSDEEQTSRREIRVDVGGGWGIPIRNVELQDAPIRNIQPLSVDMHSGPHVYAGLGFVRSIAEDFALGARVRGHFTRLRSTVENCVDPVSCTDPQGLQWAATLEGRIIVTTPDWINPYLLVGLGVVQTTVEEVTLRDIPTFPESLTYSGASVIDAGGDIGIGASLPLTNRLYLDAEFRVTGALPGGKENALAVLPFSAGVSYGF